MRTFNFLSFPQVHRQALVKAVLVAIATVSLLLTSD
ncbi:MAG: apocytochrome f, partial [Microcystis panniformis]